MLKYLTMTCVCFLASVGVSFTEQTLKTVRAVRTNTPVVDGKFTNDEWCAGGLAKDFIQIEPHEGRPASEPTKAYFLYDSQFLYVGIKCYDSEPDKIMGELSGRDSEGASDVIYLALDTYKDGRNGYFFGTTPTGVQIDGRIFNEQETDNSWDGVWYVETGICDDGWFAEFKIPFSTLSFPVKEEHVWGLNILRKVERKKEESFWQPVKRDEGFRVSNFGNLENLHGIEPGLNLQILPYATSKLRKDRLNPLTFQKDNGFTGVDIRYGVTSNLTAVLTIYPDFAQIEADEDRINLSRYPYILREKRPFFLEGASIFHTAGNSMSDGEYRTALFYSRRINQPVYGFKTTGKVGNWDMGVLHALNENDIGLKTKIENGELGSKIDPKAFYNVIRMSRDIFSRSQIGFIGMSKEYRDGFNRTFGMDTKMRFLNNYTISFEGVKSFTNNIHNGNHSINLYFSRYSDFFKFSTWYQEQAPNFIGNELGFYDYNNFRSSGGWMQLAPRLEKFGVRRMGHNINFWYKNFQNKNFFDYASLTRGWNYNFWTQTMSYWMFGAGKSFTKYFDRFDEVLYPGDSYWIRLNNNWSSKINFSINHSQGKYRTGYRWSYNSSLRIRPNNRFNMQLSYNRSQVILRDSETGSMNQHQFEIWRSKIYYHFNRNLNARLILQYNGINRQLAAYYLIAYNFKPGSFLYIAYTEQFDSESYLNNSGVEIQPNFGSSAKLLQVKLSYLIQI